MRVVVDDKIPFIKGVLEKYAQVVYLEGSKICRKDILDADALIVRTRTKCNADLLEGTKVKFIATATIGFDHIDTEYCRSRKITWTNAEGCNSSSVQQYWAAALFFLMDKFNLFLPNLTIGVVGVGNVGKKVVTLCDSLGIKVLLNDPPRERLEGSKSFITLDTIITDADIITLHVPLNFDGQDKTYHLVNANFLSKLKKNQILVNTSRGEIVETEAIKLALQNKKLKGCILDVWEDEPDIDHDLLDLVDIGTPHIAGYSADGKANGTAMCVNSFCRHFGFDLKDWYPNNVPIPSTTQIEMECTNLNCQTIISKLVRSTYNILEDDHKLRNSPQTFEKQRGEYPVRREFGTFKINLLHGNEEIEKIVKKIGFKLFINI
jgi:erythronate-4-phosphate dehydrogenase